MSESSFESQERKLAQPKTCLYRVPFQPCRNQRRIAKDTASAIPIHSTSILMSTLTLKLRMRARIRHQDLWSELRQILNRRPFGMLQRNDLNSAFAVQQVPCKTIRSTMWSSYETSAPFTSQNPNEYYRVQRQPARIPFV